MRRAFVLCTWLAFALAPPSWGGRAHADGTLGERIDRATDVVEDVAEDVSEQAEEVASSVGDKTRAATRSAADTIADGARGVADAARGAWDRLGSGTRERMRRAGRAVGDVVERGKDAAADVVGALRDETRALLMDAAEALDAKTRTLRDGERKLRWDKLRGRFALGDQPSEAVSEELRDHEYRVARLERVRKLAHEADDDATVARTDRLLELEHGRHKRRLGALSSKARAEADP